MKLSKSNKQTKCHTKEGKGTAAGRTEPRVCCSQKGQFRGLGDIKEWRTERSALLSVIKGQLAANCK